MGNIYLLDSDPLFRSFVPPEDESFMELVERFDGTPISESWMPFDFEYNDDSIDLPLGDFPSIFLPHIPVFSVRAAEALEPVLRNNGELLPIRCGDETYLALNVTSVVPALAKASDIRYFPSGKIMDVSKYVLERKSLRSNGIFKLLEVPLMNVFVTDEFCEVIQRYQLRGFSFKPIALE